jgi:hypothetical protein
MAWASDARAVVRRPSTPCRPHLRRAARRALHPVAWPGGHGLEVAPTGRDDSTYENKRTCLAPAGAGQHLGRSAMRTQKLVVVFLSALLFVFAFGASAKPRVQVDYDHSANFAVYKTFGFVPKTGTEYDGYPEQITHDMKAAVRRELESRGYHYTESSPDLLVNFGARLMNKMKDDELAKQTVGYYSYRDIAVTKTWSTYTFDKGVKEYTEGTVNVELIDAKAKALVWEGVAIGEIRKASMKDSVDVAINRVVGAIFKKYTFRAGS